MGSCCFKCKCFRRYPRKKIVLLLVGLDNAGKTTAAKGLAGEIVENTIPTVGFTATKPKTKGYDVTIYDLGGGTQIRDIWSSYYYFVHGIIFVVDASDLARIEESKIILENLLLNEKLAGKPVLVLANKQDKPYALDELDIVEALQLEPLVNRQKCHTLVKVCSALTTSSKKKIDKRLLVGYRWLLHQIYREYDTLSERVERDGKEELERFETRRKLQRMRLEESNKQEAAKLSNEVEICQNNNVNGVLASGEPSGTENVASITAHVREQFVEKIQRPKFKLKGRRRSNKIHPENDESSEQQNIQFRTFKSIVSNTSSTATEPSMTLKALTSPLHVNNKRTHQQFQRSNPTNRPVTSRSLGNEVGGWGLDRELDIIYPIEFTNHVCQEDMKNGTVVEYLKK